MQAVEICKEYQWFPPYKNKDMYILMKQKKFQWYPKEGKWIPNGVVDTTPPPDLPTPKKRVVYHSDMVLKKGDVEVFFSICKDIETGNVISSSFSLFHEARDEDRIGKFVDKMSEVGLTCEIFRIGIKTPWTNILVRNISILIAEHLANQF